jgi:hypothetical protein
MAWLTPRAEVTRTPVLNNAGLRPAADRMSADPVGTGAPYPSPSCRTLILKNSVPGQFVNANAQTTVMAQSKADGAG